MLHISSAHIMLHSPRGHLIKYQFCLGLSPRKEEEMNKMEFTEFTKAVAGQIREFLPERFSDADVELKVVTKNNNVKLTGLTIKSVESRVAPTIYLEQFYENYRDGEDMDKILRQIAECRVKNDAPEGLDIENIMNFEFVRTRLVPRLVNLELNRGLLEERPHKVIEDLAVEYYVILSKDSELGTAGVAVTNGLMETWKVSLDEIDEAARKNLPVLEKSTFRSMFDVLSGSMGEDFAGMLPEESGMYILSNSSGCYGASNILDANMMAHIYEKFDGEFYIIPSSVHEVIVIPSKLGIDGMNLASMIREVNMSTVSLEDRLSDHAYTYSISEGLKAV